MFFRFLGIFQGFFQVSFFRCFCRYFLGILYVLFFSQVHFNLLGISSYFSGIFQLFFVCTFSDFSCFLGIFQVFFQVFCRAFFRHFSRCFCKYYLRYFFRFNTGIFSGLFPGFFAGIILGIFQAFFQARFQVMFLGSE